jgi:hypothetical protein
MQTTGHPPARFRGYSCRIPRISATSPSAAGGVPSVRIRPMGACRLDAPASALGRRLDGEGHELRDRHEEPGQHHRGTEDAVDAAICHSVKCQTDECHEDAAPDYDAPVPDSEAVVRSLVPHGCILSDWSASCLIRRRGGLDATISSRREARSSR